MGRKAHCSKEGLNRGAWTAHEDDILVSYISTHGVGKWRTLPKRAGLKRCGKSCRLRWLNYLRPDIKRGNISDEEEELIIRLHKLLGNRWSLIAGRLPGRTDNEIKNYWNTTLAKRLQAGPSSHDDLPAAKSEEKCPAAADPPPPPPPPAAGSNLVHTQAMDCAHQEAMFDDAWKLEKDYGGSQLVENFELGGGDGISNSKGWYSDDLMDFGGECNLLENWLENDSFQQESFLTSSFWLLFN
ncbi:hypothetical protein Cni_G11350 [Canna indica]|uniref:Transcription factor MYB1 n=1 Tax=Canna indica TaxID=4628 RepID=A0AAQ3Q826_9LILI|nr:hypothetical protein Cni_G11350 [Canna indica]